MVCRCRERDAALPSWTRPGSIKMIPEEPGTMNPLSVDALASATKPEQPADVTGPTFFKALLLATMLLTGGLAAQPAAAGLLITTTGTITSGSETGGLFGLPTTTTSLVGFSYTLLVSYN